MYGARTNSTARSGAWCFQLHVASVGAGPVVELAQANIPINGGTTYPFTFYAKALTGSAGYNAQWRIVWNAGGDTGFHPFTPGNNTYALSSNAVTAPLSATSATLFFYLAGAASPSLSADLLLDDVAFASGAVPPPTSTNAPALQVVAGALISFETTSNASYQVQWSSGATPSSDTWSNLCPAIIGDGRTNRAFDPALGRSYRVLMVE